MVVQDVAEVAETMAKRQAEQMLPLLKRHEIQVLRRAGHSQDEVADIAAVSKRTVRRVEAEKEVTHVDDRAEVETRRIGRPSKTEAYRPLVEKLLGEDSFNGRFRDECLAQARFPTLARARVEIELWRV